MAVIKFNQEIKLKVSAKRMFKALVTDAHVVLPKISPNFIKSIDILHGDATGVGSIKQTNFAGGAPQPYLKHKIEAVDVGNYASKYSLIEGSPHGDKIEKVYYNQKFEETSDGGCVLKIAGEYHTKGDAKLSEEEIKADKDEFAKYLKLLEESLLAHPDICA